MNQLESNQRPLTEALRYRLAELLQVDLDQFAPSGTERLVAELRDVVGDPSFRDDVALSDLRELAATMPSVGRLLVELHRRYRQGLDLNEAIASRIDRGTPMAYEEVRERFYAHRNYIPSLDTAAERAFAEAGLTIGATAAGLTERLAVKHGPTVVDLSPAESVELKRRQPHCP